MLHVEDGADESATYRTLVSTIDEGEAEAIALAMMRQPALLLMDDGPGRRAARQQGLVMTGTLGVLVEAKRRGVLGAVRPALDALLATRFRCSQGVPAEVLRLAGEGTAPARRKELLPPRSA